MCAITGILTKDIKLQKSLVGMTRLLKHRGPNDEGFMHLDGDFVTRSCSSETNSESKKLHNLNDSRLNYSSLNKAVIGLGHRRLSIIDVTAQGHQPMSRDGKTWITYNGEVFNYLELKVELSSLGFKFKTNTDTEVILAAYEKWGVKCFEKFNGMWSLAILDAEKRELILCRDRFGVKPLYYKKVKGGVAFASEIKAFTALPGWEAIANEAAVHDYLFKGLTDHSDQTFFKDVNQLLPGHYMKLKIDCINNQQLEQIRWYEFPTKGPELKFEDAVEQFKELFFDSVKLRMRSDVKIGSCLSGGLDSSSIVGSMRKIMPVGEIETITACSKHAEFDEYKYAEMVIDSTRANSSRVFPDPKKLIEKIDELVWHQDEPFGSASIFAQWCVFEEAKRLGIPVMLDGQGADETHCGYNSFLRPYVQSELYNLRFHELWKNLLSIRPSRTKVIGSILRGGADLSMPSFLTDISASHKEKKKKRGWYFGEDRIMESYSLNRQENLSQHSKFMMNHGMRTLLHWEDRNSMAHSIESRVPFLDYRMIPLLLSLNDNQRVAGGWTKSIIRHSMDGILPQKVIFRKDKMGFVTPESIWAKNELKDLYLKELENLPKHWGELIGDKIKVSYDSFLSGEIAYDSLFWKVMCLNRWRIVFNVKL
ncbi:asparagine synthase (glutamine-hydrolyzing) [Opitutales bacterium]|nr:asparagine synthase (glutamine-hydrolyzing) [Opitutales bacterium]